MVRCLHTSCKDIGSTGNIYKLQLQRSCRCVYVQVILILYVSNPLPDGLVRTWASIRKLKTSWESVFCTGTILDSILLRGLPKNFLTLAQGLS